MNIRDEKIVVDGKLMEANAYHSGGQFDYRATEIESTELAIGTDPFAEVARAPRPRSTYGRDADAKLTAKDVALLRKVIDAAASDEDVKPPKVRPAAPAKERLSYGRDADSVFISRYLKPEQLCHEAAAQLNERAHENQKHNPNRGYWAGLIHFLISQPKDSRIKNCPAVTLSVLVSKTLAA